MTSALSKRTPRIPSSLAFHLTQILIQRPAWIYSVLDSYFKEDTGWLCVRVLLMEATPQATWFLRLSTFRQFAVFVHQFSIWKVECWEYLSEPCRCALSDWDRCRLGAGDSVRTGANNLFMYLSTEVVGRLNCTHPPKGLTTAGREEGGLKTCECNLALCFSWPRVNLLKDLI